MRCRCSTRRSPTAPTASTPAPSPTCSGARRSTCAPRCSTPSPPRTRPASWSPWARCSTLATSRAGSPTRPDLPAAPDPHPPGVTVGPLRKRRPVPTPPADAAPEAVAEASDPLPAEPKEPTETKAKAEAEAEAAAPTVDVDDVILAWATVLPELSVATRSAVQEAQPLSVDGDIVTFGVSPRLIEAARPRFRREANTIRDALSRHVGRSG